MTPHQHAQKRRRIINGYGKDEPNIEWRPYNHRDFSRGSKEIADLYNSTDRTDQAQLRWSKVADWLFNYAPDLLEGKPGEQLREIIMEESQQ